MVSNSKLSENVAMNNFFQNLMTKKSNPNSENRRKW
ncbi:MAG: hypothetical protein MRERC_11c032 [Mycoplasmataceae bacterium RC_NB112A]|nr:MAG: hypothetical protein MRERC_11c032 [Mycoplasmataceae bacterium RC_NB112A]